MRAIASHAVVVVLLACAAFSHDVEQPGSGIFYPSSIIQAGCLGQYWTKAFVTGTGELYGDILILPTGGTFVFTSFISKFSAFVQHAHFGEPDRRFAVRTCVQWGLLVLSATSYGITMGVSLSELDPAVMAPMLYVTASLMTASYIVDIAAYRQNLAHLRRRREQRVRISPMLQIGEFSSAGLLAQVAF